MASVMESREVKRHRPNLHKVEELKVNVRRKFYNIFQEYLNAGCKLVMEVKVIPA
jgi:hypothetical protein